MKTSNRLLIKEQVMKIGVFCSGGDSPGMNACTRAVVQAATSQGHEVVGIMRGYHGLINEQFFDRGLLTPALTSRWASHGGAHLRSSRSEAFRTLEGRQQAVEVLQRNQIDALIPIGGNGTFTGATKLAEIWDGQIIGCPGTIDNDLVGTDYTIGFSTAVETAVEAVDKIRDTASSHDRMFLIEVMGRHSGYIALYTAIASGADVVAIPETETNFPKIVQHLSALKQAGRSMAIMIVAEGDEEGGVQEIDQKLREHKCPFSTRTVTLGHLQRGGTPTPEDRRRAAQMGCAAVQAILDGKTGLMAGSQDSETVLIPLASTFETHRKVPDSLLDVLRQLHISF